MPDGNLGISFKTEGMHLVRCFPCIRFEHVSSNISALLWLDATFLLDFLHEKIGALTVFFPWLCIFGLAAAWSPLS